jgi:hypothetical protein
LLVKVVAAPLWAHLLAMAAAMEALAVLVVEVLAATLVMGARVVIGLLALPFLVAQGQAAAAAVAVGDLIPILNLMTVTKAVVAAVV